MSLALTSSEATGLLDQPRMQINWEQAARLRNIRAMELSERGEEYPRYLILPEVQALLESTLDLRHRLALTLLFTTGARVSELIQLKPESFRLEGELPCVRLPTLKKRDRRKPKNKAYAQKLRQQGVELDNVPHRWVPFVTPDHQRAVQSFVVTQRVKPFERLFPISARTIQTWVNQAVESFQARSDGYSFGFPITPRTFRHSFAMNACLQGVPQRILKEWMGHSSMASTEVYQRLLDVESHVIGRQIAWTL